MRMMSLPSPSVSAMRAPSLLDRTTPPKSVRTACPPKNEHESCVVYWSGRPSVDQALPYGECEWQMALTSGRAAGGGGSQLESPRWRPLVPRDAADVANRAWRSRDAPWWMLEWIRKPALLTTRRPGLPPPMTSPSCETVMMSSAVMSAKARPNGLT